MKQIRIQIKVTELSEDGFRAYVYPDDASELGEEIYGNTLIQIRQRIGKRLEKLIVEEE